MIPGVMFSNGHLWKQQRRFGLVTMRKMGVGKKDQECQIQEEACHLVEYLRGTNGMCLCSAFGSVWVVVILLKNG